MTAIKAPAAPMKAQKNPWLLPAAIAALSLTIPAWPFVDSQLIGILTRMLIFISLGQSWNLIAGIAGQPSLGHGIFFGIGAYATAILFNTLGINPWLNVWVGVGLSILTAIAIGAALFRLRGVYFALATIAITLGFEKVTRFMTDFTGGDAGYAVRFVGTSLSAGQSRDPTPFFFAALLLVLAFYFGTRLILRSALGLRLRAIRDDEDAARAAGVNVFGGKLLALVISAGMASIVGTLHVQFYMAIDPGSAFGLLQAIQIQLPALIGGLGTAIGPILGGAIMIALNEFLNWISTRLGIHGVELIVYGIILLVIVISAPLGLVGRLYNPRRQR